MPVRLPSNPVPYSDFLEWVKNHTYYGLSSQRQSPSSAVPGAPFVRPEDLKKYWSADNIKSVMRVIGISMPVRTIQDSFCQTFSTLVAANAVEYLLDMAKDGLNDSKMPLLELPTRWIGNGVMEDLYSKIERYQWKFFPRIFDSQLLDSDLDERIVLPIVERKQIEPSRPSAARIYKIQVAPGCHKFTSTDENNFPSATPDTFVLKSYNASNQIEEYRREIRALNAFQTRDRNVIWSFGSFTQCGTANVVVEYANGKDLWYLFTETPPPTSLRDIASFWQSMFKILKGLRRIHTLHRDGSFMCYHGDLKPDNIFLHRSAASQNNPYCFEPKIADFGNADIQRARIDGQEIGESQACDLGYGAPERDRTHRYLERDPINISAAVDIFSLGCVFAEACVWMVYGIEAFYSFATKRADATDGDGCFYKFSFGNCTILKCVSTLLQEIQRLEEEPQHSATRAFARVALDHMLQPTPGSRKQVELLISELGSVFESTREDTELPPDFELSPFAPSKSPESSVFSPVSPWDSSLISQIATPPTDYSSQSISSHGSAPQEIPPPQSARPRGLKRSYPFERVDEKKRIFKPFPRATIGDVLKYREQLKNSRPGRRPRASVERIMKRLGKCIFQRDQLFYIDDSDSMREYRPEIRRTFDALGWIAQEFDDNGVELFFGDPIQNHYNSKDSDLLQVIDKHEFSNIPPSMIERNLAQLIENVIKPRLRVRSLFPFWRPRAREMNVFIFTDGDWAEDEDETEAAGVDGPIRMLMETLNELKLNGTHVTFQFLRFGNNRRGIQRLKYLDDFADTRKGEKDIVDTEPFNGNVYKMFIGSMNRRMDRQEAPLEGYDTEENSSYSTAPESSVNSWALPAKKSE